MGARRACGWAALAPELEPELEPELKADLKRAELEVLQALRFAIRIIGAGAGEAARACEYAGGPQCQLWSTWASSGARARAFDFKGGEI